jgi:hypothetical protein
MSYYVSRCAGVAQDVAVQPNLARNTLERACEELAGWTGETDSEADDI